MERIAERYNLSPRTIYRDIKALNEVGIPLYFEPAKGYAIAQGYFLPPLLFTVDEANAILLLHSLAKRFSDEAIAKNSDSALAKIKSVLKLQDFEKTEAISNKIEVYTSPDRIGKHNYLSQTQTSIIERKVLEIVYTDNNKNKSKRNVEPIGIIFYNNQWHIIGWCWLRKGYRDFKANQISELKITAIGFRKTHTHTIQEYMKIF